MQSNTLFDTVKPYLKKGMGVLDVGCSNFENAVAFRDFGCNVTGIDIRKPQVEVPHDIDFFQVNFTEYKSGKKIDVLFISNVAPFITKSDFLKLLEEYSQQVKIIAVRAFTENPEPAPDQPIELYQVSDFLGLSLNPAVLKTWSDSHEDMSGNLRKWHTIDYIGTSDPETVFGKQA